MPEGPASAASSSSSSSTTTTTTTSSSTSSSSTSSSTSSTSSSSSTTTSTSVGGGDAVRFIYSAESEVPFFYRNRISRYICQEEDYVSRFQEAYLARLPEDEEHGVHIEPTAGMRAVDAIGRMPLQRNIAACTIPRLFYDGAAFRVRPWTGHAFCYHDVTLRRRHLRHALLSREFAKHGKVRRSRYIRLNDELQSAVVKHAVEVDLSEQRGRRYVVFLARHEVCRDAIVRELARDSVSVGNLRLKLSMPEDSPPPRGWPPFFRNSLRRLFDQASVNMKERLPITHCKFTPSSEREPVCDGNSYLDPRRPPTFVKDYSTSNFDSETLLLEAEAKKRMKNGEANVELASKLVVGRFGTRLVKYLKP